MKVDKIVPVSMKTSIGEIQVDCNISLEDLGKEFKASVCIGDEIQNQHIFRKKDIDKLPTGINSNLFKGMKGFDTEYILSIIQSLEEELKLIKEKQQHQITKAYEKAQIDILKQGKDFYHYCIDNDILPSNYIMKASRWKVASEEINILRIILAILSTMRGEPVNIISVASAGSGKSIIENVAFDMVHEHNYVIMNYSTPASFKNACIDNPYLFKNKIVRFGDRGSAIAEEVMLEVNSIIKILNSEGYYHSSKMISQNDIIDIELIGKCAMCFSKVENELSLDSQDVSRGILWTPSLDNDNEFKDFYRWLDFKTNEDFEYEDKLFSNIRNYLDWLVSLDIEIINPYKDALDWIFKGNEAYRRLLNKQDNILKMLALINLPNKEIIDGNRIYVTNQDFEMYYKLFYKSLMALKEFKVKESDINLYHSLKLRYDSIDEEDVYNKFTELLDENHSDFYDEHFPHNDLFFTVNEVINNMSNVRSVHNIIGNIENGKNQRNKIRSTLKRLENFIGELYIPDENWKYNGVKPTLYYIKNNNLANKKVEYFIKSSTFDIIYRYYGENDIRYIINDMKAHCKAFKKRSNRLVGCIEDINDKSIFNCPIINNPEYMELEKINLDKYI